MPPPHVASRAFLRIQVVRVVAIWSWSPIPVTLGQCRALAGAYPSLRLHWGSAASKSRLSRPHWDYIGPVHSRGNALIIERCAIVYATLHSICTGALRVHSVASFPPLSYIGSVHRRRQSPESCLHRDYIGALRRLVNVSDSIGSVLANCPRRHWSYIGPVLLPSPPVRSPIGQNRPSRPSPPSSPESHWCTASRIAIPDIGDGAVANRVLLHWSYIGAEKSTGVRTPRQALSLPSFGGIVRRRS